MDQQVKTTKISCDGLIYKLNIEEKTASLLEYQFISRNIYIPKSVVYKSNEYIITSISKNAFINCYDITSVQFSPDSKVEIIGESAFHSTTIKSISIPSSLKHIHNYAFGNCGGLIELNIPDDTELKTIGKMPFNNVQIKNLTIPSDLELDEEWSLGLMYLQNIKIVKREKEYIKLYDDIYLLSKSDKNSSNFDILVYARHDIKTAIIPPCVKIIGHNSFTGSQVEKIIFTPQVTYIRKSAFAVNSFLTEIEFPPDSQLEEIGNSAFQFTKIQSIVLPKSVKKICEYAFQNCDELQKVEFSLNSELKIIEAKAFADSGLKSITLPSCVELKDKWCIKTKFLNEFKINIEKEENIKNLQDILILGKTDKNSSNFDVILFARRDLKNIIIPPTIREIAPYAFSQSLVQKVGISLNVTKISEGAFFQCSNLVAVISQAKSNLKIIQNKAFSFSSISTLSIPSSIVKLEDRWCEHTKNLIRFQINIENEENIKDYEGKYILGKTDLNSSNFNIIRFARRDIINPIIPPSVKIIGPCSFYESQIQNIALTPSVKEICSHAFALCSNFTQLEIPYYSQLETIGKQAFCYTSIDSFIVPSSVTRISEEVFRSCHKLNTFKFSEKSKIKEIEEGTFYDSSIESISIPFYIEKIGNFAFNSCKKLKKIEFTQNSELRIIGCDVFTNSVIESFSIPTKVTEIGDYIFAENQKLQLVEFDENSETESLDKGIFEGCPSVVIYIPLKLSKLIKSLHINKM